MNLLGSAIRKLRKERGWTQGELSKRMPLNEKRTYKQSTISGHESGASTIDEVDIRNYAKAFEINPVELFMLSNGNDSNLLSDEAIKIRNRLAHGTVKYIPILGTIACGAPITAEENIEGYREEPTHSLPSGNLFFLRTRGDSMVPTIPEDSYVLIREQSEVEDGEIAAVLMNGDTEATLKRVKRQGDIVMLLAENKDYPPYIITENNPARVLGKAIKVSFDLLPR